MVLVLLSCSKVNGHLVLSHSLVYLCHCMLYEISLSLIVEKCYFFFGFFKQKKKQKYFKRNSMYKVVLSLRLVCRLLSHYVILCKELMLWCMLYVYVCFM